MYLAEIRCVDGCVIREYVCGYCGWRVRSVTGPAHRWAEYPKPQWRLAEELYESVFKKADIWPWVV